MGVIRSGMLSTYLKVGGHCQTISHAPLNDTRPAGFQHGCPQARPGKFNTPLMPMALT
jgi:hypothetical protein